MTFHRNSLESKNTERAARQKEVDYAKGSVGLEGFKIDDVSNIEFERYINGEIDCSTLVDNILSIVKLRREKWRG